MKLLSLQAIEILRELRRGGEIPEDFFPMNLFPAFFFSFPSLFLSPNLFFVSKKTQPGAFRLLILQQN